MRLIEGRNDALPGHQRFVSGESTGNRSVEVRLGERILQPCTDSEALQIPDVQYGLRTLRTCGVEIDGDEYAANRNFMIFECIVSGMAIQSDFQADLRIQLL